MCVALIMREFAVCSVRMWECISSCVFGFTCVCVVHAPNCVWIGVYMWDASVCAYNEKQFMSARPEDGGEPAQEFKWVGELVY